MASLGYFLSLREKYSQIADFVLIYIAEAHPSERGHFRDNYDIGTHQSMEARIDAAKVLLEEAGAALADCPILVDPMDDRAGSAYCAFPERLYIILDGKVVHVGGLGPLSYDLKEIETFLTKFQQ